MFCWEASSRIEHTFEFTRYASLSCRRSSHLRWTLELLVDAWGTDLEWNMHPASLFRRSSAPKMHHNNFGEKVPPKQMLIRVYITNFYEFTNARENHMFAALSCVYLKTSYQKEKLALIATLHLKVCLRSGLLFDVQKARYTRRCVDKAMALKKSCGLLAPDENCSIKNSKSGIKNCRGFIFLK